MSNKERIIQINSIVTDFKSLTQQLRSKSDSSARTKARKKLAQLDRKIINYRDDFGRKDIFFENINFLKKEASEIIDANF